MKRWCHIIISILIVIALVSSLFLAAGSIMNPTLLLFVFGLAVLLFIANMICGIRHCRVINRSKGYMVAVVICNMLPMIFTSYLFILMLFVVTYA